MYHNVLLPLRCFHRFACVLEVQHSVTLLDLHQDVKPSLANFAYDTKERLHTWTQHALQSGCARSRGQVMAQHLTL